MTDKEFNKYGEKEEKVSLSRDILLQGIYESIAEESKIIQNVEKLQKEYKDTINDFENTADSSKLRDLYNKSNEIFETLEYVNDIECSAKDLNKEFGLEDFFTEDQIQTLLENKKTFLRKEGKINIQPLVITIRENAKLFDDIETPKKEELKSQYLSLKNIAFNKYLYRAAMFGLAVGIFLSSFRDSIRAITESSQEIVDSSKLKEHELPESAFIPEEKNDKVAQALAVVQQKIDSINKTLLEEQYLLQETNKEAQEVLSTISTKIETAVDTTSKEAHESLQRYESEKTSSELTEQSPLSPESQEIITVYREIQEQKKENIKMNMNDEDIVQERSENITLHEERVGNIEVGKATMSGIPPEEDFKRIEAEIIKPSDIVVLKVAGKDNNLEYIKDVDTVGTKLIRHTISNKKELLHPPGYIALPNTFKDEKGNRIPVKVKKDVFTGNQYIETKYTGKVSFELKYVGEKVEPYTLKPEKKHTWTEKTDTVFNEVKKLIQDNKEKEAVSLLTQYIKQNGFYSTSPAAYEKYATSLEERDSYMVMDCDVAAELLEAYIHELGFKANIAIVYADNMDGNLVTAELHGVLRVILTNGEVIYLDPTPYDFLDPHEQYLWQQRSIDIDNNLKNDVESKLSSNLDKNLAKAVGEIYKQAITFDKEKRIAFYKNILSSIENKSNISLDDALQYQVIYEELHNLHAPYNYSEKVYEHIRYHDPVILDANANESMKIGYKRYENDAVRGIMTTEDFGYLHIQTPQKDVGLEEEKNGIRYEIREVKNGKNVILVNGKRLSSPAWDKVTDILTVDVTSDGEIIALVNVSNKEGRVIIKGKEILKDGDFGRIYDILGFQLTSKDEIVALVRGKDDGDRYLIQNSTLLKTGVYKDNDVYDFFVDISDNIFSFISGHDVPLKNGKKLMDGYWKDVSYNCCHEIVNNDILATVILKEKGSFKILDKEGNMKFNENIWDGKTVEMIIGSMRTDKSGNLIAEVGLKNKERVIVKNDKTVIQNARFGKDAKYTSVNDLVRYGDVEFRGEGYLALKEFKQADVKETPEGYVPLYKLKQIVEMDNPLFQTMEHDGLFSDIELQRKSIEFLKKELMTQYSLRFSLVTEAINNLSEHSLNLLVKELIEEGVPYNNLTLLLANRYDINASHTSSYRIKKYEDRYKKDHKEIVLDTENTETIKTPIEKSLYDIVESIEEQYKNLNKDEKVQLLEGLLDQIDKKSHITIEDATLYTMIFNAYASHNILSKYPFSEKVAKLLEEKNPLIIVSYFDHIDKFNNLARPNILTDYPPSGSEEDCYFPLYDHYYSQYNQKLSDYVGGYPSASKYGEETWKIDIGTWGDYLTIDQYMLDQIRGDKNIADMKYNWPNLNILFEGETQWKDYSIIHKYQPLKQYYIIKAADDDSIFNTLVKDAEEKITEGYLQDDALIPIMTKRLIKYILSEDISVFEGINLFGTNIKNEIMNSNLYEKAVYNSDSYFNNREIFLDAFNYLLFVNPEVLIKDEDKEEFFTVIEYGQESKQFQEMINREYNLSQNEKIKRISDIVQKIRHKKDW